MHGEWSGATITVSSAASDATQLGGTAPGSGPAPTVDGDPATAGSATASRRALRPVAATGLRHPDHQRHASSDAPVPAAIGAPVKWLEVSTPNGRTAVKVEQARRADHRVAAGRQHSVATRHSDSHRRRIAWNTVRHQRTLRRRLLRSQRAEDRTDPFRHGPAEYADGRIGERVEPEPGVPRPQRLRRVRRTACGAAMPSWRYPEEPSRFQRTLSVPETTVVAPTLTVRRVRATPSKTLLSVPGRITARVRATSATHADLPSLPPTATHAPRGRRRRAPQDRAARNRR